MESKMSLPYYGVHEARRNARIIGMTPSLIDCIGIVK